MSEVKYTPGPWTLQPYDGDEEWCQGDWVIKDATGTSIMGDTPYYPWHSSNPNDARLIAAAPEMLEALKAVVDDLGHFTEVSESIFHSLHLADRAIAKAEGK